MSDIIVTTPKGLAKMSAAEAEAAKRRILAGEDVVYVRTLGMGLPKRLKIGDRVFYILDGYVRGYAKVRRKGYHQPPGADRPVAYVHLDPVTWTWIEPIRMRGTQGYRYATQEFLDKVKVIGGWLDPMPELF